MTPSSAAVSAPSPVPLAIARSMLSLGIEASFAFWTASASAGLPSTSPPPSFAATVIARASFVKSLPRRASTTAFLCLIDAHLECPDMGSILARTRPSLGLGRVPIPAEIFKAYDVRGIYGEQIDGDVAELIGRGFVRVISQLARK